MRWWNQGRTAICLLMFATVAPAVSEAVTVATGDEHTVVVDDTGNVWTWGGGTSGQLGLGNTADSSLPTMVPGLANIVAVAAGQQHTLALASDGKVWAWGGNARGQVGDGTTTTRTSPVQVLTGASKIAAGDFHSVAWKSDGTVLAWGLNNLGQLGDGTTTQRNSPQAVPGLSNVTAIGAAGSHTLVAKSDGTVWAWGYNATGQLGDGTQTTRTSAVQVEGLDGLTIAAVSAGTGHSLALTDTGLVYAWGQNSHGQLGHGTIDTFLLAPVRVADLQGVTAIASCGLHSAAIEDDGTPWCWGKGTHGQLGDGVPLASTYPLMPGPGPEDVVAIAASSGEHTVAVTAAGEVWAWGANTYGQIGDGTVGLDRLTPVKVMDAGFAPMVGTPIFSVMPSTYNTAQTVSLSSATAGSTIRYTTDGTEPTTSSTQYTSAISVTVTTTIRATAYKAGLVDSNVASGTFTLRVVQPTITPGTGTYSTTQSATISTSTSGATIRYTTDGTMPVSTSPVYSGAIAVDSSGRIMAYATKPDWSDSGINVATYTLNFGTQSAPTPSPGAGTYAGSVAVTLSASSGAAIRYTTNGTEPTASSALYSGAITLTTTTTLKAKAFKADWTQSATTTTVYTLESAAPTFSPGAGTYAIGDTITLSCATAGATIHYTLDGTDPTQSDASTPSGGVIFVGNFTLKARAYAPNTNPSAVTSATYAESGTPASGAAAGGASHSLLLKPDGTVWAWGLNSSGQLGDTTTTQRTTPVQASTPAGITAIAAGAAHSLALTTGGNVYAWGSNSVGQLGIGATPASTSTPTQITTLSNVVAIAAGTNHSLAVKSDGTVWAWGGNGNGQLGDGSTTNRNTPVQVTVSSSVNLTSVTAVAAGANHSLAVKSDGTAWAWGLNGNGQVGIASTTTPQTRAVQVNTVTGVTTVEGGELHSVARTSGGTAWAWGNNANGQLGTGNFSQATSPQEVVGLPGVGDVRAGQYFSMARAADWNVSTWGFETGLGTGSQSNTNVAGTVWGLPPIVAIAAGNTHAIAIAQDGSVWCWGANTSGQIGDGTTAERRTPVKVAEANFAWKAAAPVFGTAPGTHATTLNVTISTATSGATIYYTTDGSTPTTSSSVYSTAVAVSQTTTLQAKVVKSGLSDSNVTAGLYTLKAAAPGISPIGGTHSSNQTVTLTSASPGVTIRYTTNGQEPTASDPGVSSGQTISVTQSLTFKASVWRSGWTTSNVAAATFTMKVATPTLSPTGGVFSANQSVTISTATSGATIRYTTDGREPAPSDPTITSGSALTLSKSTTVKAKAFRTGWSHSDTASGSFVLNLGTVATPTFSPAAGTYSAAQTVTLSTTTAGSVIRYTLDGSDPSPWSPLFAAPIPVQATLTIKARAYGVDQASSSVASAGYTINAGAVEAPTFGIAAGSYVTQRTVVVSCATAGATIRYTTNGADPTTSDTTIASGGSLTIGAATVLKAAAWKSGMTTSPVTRADYLITGAIAAGGAHTLALKTDGTVWSWGTNTSGELGDGTTVAKNTPVQVSSLTGIVAIAAGAAHSLALKSDGTVWGWGANLYGQVGDGTSGSGTNRSTPVQVTGLTTAVAVAAGKYHSLAVLANGTVKAWGYNGNGRLGNNSTTNASTPVTVSSLTTATAVAAGVDHSLALLSDGTVSGWGANAEGQLGAATPSQSLVPMAIANLSGVVAVAAGDGFTYALRANGDAAGVVWTAGAGLVGQLGDGTLVASRKAVASGPTGVRVMTTGDRHGLAFRQDGTTIAWGADDQGQLGDGTTITSRSKPVRVFGAGELVRLAAGDSYSVALRADGSIAVWGYGGSHLGLGGSGAETTLPITVPNFTVAASSWLNQDTDDDGLSNAAEYRLGSDPLTADTNADGIPDGQEAGPGRRPTDPDTDGDGLSNALEFERGTDPLVADTDRDATADGADCYPLDNTRTSCASSNPSDTTPPTITLEEPPGATPVP